MLVNLKKSSGKTCETPDTGGGGRKEGIRTYMMKVPISPHQWHDLTYSEPRSAREDIERVKRQRKEIQIREWILVYASPQEIALVRKQN
jgi:hypothetical protein